MSKIKSVLATLFIIVNLMMMIRAQLPANAPVIEFLYTPVTAIQNYFSIWRGWSMFAPDPLRTNQFIDAKVVFQDGSILIWDFPRPKEDELFSRYIWGERFRKYTSDGLRLDSNSHLWPDAARFVLKKIASTHYKKRPVSVTLRRNWQNIPDWDDEFVPHGEKPKAAFKTYEYYTYKVDAYEME